MIKAEEVDMDYYMPKKEEDIVAELQPKAALKTGEDPAMKPAGSKSNNPLVEKSPRRNRIKTRVLNIFLYSTSNHI